MPEPRTVLRARLRALALLGSEPRLALAERRRAREFARSHPGIAVDLSGRPVEGAQRILVVSLSNAPPQVQLEAILVKTLQLRGARVSVLLWRTAWYARALFRALAIHDVVFLNDYAATSGDANATATQALEECSNVQELLRFTYGRARVGRQALSSIVRTSREPLVRLEDDGVQEALSSTLAYAIGSVDDANRMLADVRPDQLLLVERGYAGLGSIFDVALQRGIPVVQFQAAHRDDAFQLKRYTLENYDQHPRSLDAATWARLLDEGMTSEREQRLDRELADRAEGKWFMARRLRHSTGARGPEALREKLGLDPNKQTAVLFSHVLWDASMFYYRDLYPDQGRWFVETVKLAAESDDVQWLVKLHPALSWKLRMEHVHGEPAEVAMIREAIGSLPPHMLLIQPDDDVDNTDLFQIIDAGVTIRGTVGLELPRLGIPVLTAGTSDYSGRGFTVDAETVEAYEHNVRAIRELGRLDAEQVRTANLYAYGIFCVRPWRFDAFSLDFLPVDTAGATLEHRLRVNVDRLVEFERAPDLAAFARWVLDTRDADYVDEAELGAPI